MLSSVTMRCFAGLTVGLLVFGTACSQGSDAREVGVKKSNESVQDVRKLVILDNAGDIKISGEKNLSLKVKATLSTTEEAEGKDKSALAEVNVQTEAGPDALTLDLRWDLPKNYGSLVEIEASRELTLDIKDGSGDITISDWEGEVVIKDGTGDVFLDNVKEYKIESKATGKLIVDGEEESYD